MSEAESSIFLLLPSHLLVISPLPLCFTAHVGLPECYVALTNCQDWCSSLDPISSLPLSPPRQLFLKLEESRLFLGSEPAINPTTQIPWDTGASLSNAMRDLLTAWQTRVATAPALQLSSCAGVSVHSLVWSVGATCVDGAQPLAANSWSYSREMLLVKKKKKKASVLEQRKLWIWSNIPVKHVHASNWWLASFLAALLC